MDALNTLAPIAHWFPRLALAGVFLYHGLDKFGNLEGVAQMMQKPTAVALLVALAETVGALLILVGGISKAWMTRLGALLLVPVMLGAIFIVHLKNGWNFMNGGIEFQFTLLMIQLYFLIKGNETVRPSIVR
jgi:putative oxidoreductase